MGGDGGSIPLRIELVKNKQKKEHLNKNETERGKWEVCALTNEPLHSPLVCDFLGHLYNKESILRRLVEKTMPSSLSYIRSLKDIIELKLNRNTNKIVCPISLIEVGNTKKFVALPHCGCVFSFLGLAEIGGTACPQCGESYEKEKLVVLNADESEIEELKKVFHDELYKKKRKRKEKEKGKENRHRKHIKKYSGDRNTAKDHLAPHYGDKTIYKSIFSSKKSLNPCHFEGTHLR